MITSKTNTICIFGHPVKHSKSPLMHNMSLNEKKIDAIYLAYDIEPAKLEDAIKGFRAMNFLGANITIPHKEKIIPFLDELTEEAEIIGAVNTLFWEDGKLIGDNTDGRGFIISLMKDGSFDPKEKKVLVLGAGGASKAICSKLSFEGVRELNIFDIDNEKAQDLKNHISKVNFNAKVNVVFKEKIEEKAKESDLIVNCTPVGMKDTDPMLLSEEVFSSKQTVFDLIYNPEKTKLLKTAEKKGASILNGLGMLVYQGGLSFERWTEVEPDTRKMFDIIKKNS